MSDQNTTAVGLEMFAKLFNHVHAAMLATGAANGDGHVGSVIGFESTDPSLEKTGDVLVHVCNQLVRFEKFHNRGISAG